MHKATIEKEAKGLEQSVISSTATDNKSVHRALARLQAAKKLYPEMSEEDIYRGLIELFYKDAAWQPSWEKPLTEAAPNLAAAMKTALRAPAARVRTKAEKVATPAPSGENPEATITAKAE